MESGESVLPKRFYLGKLKRAKVFTGQNEDSPASYVRLPDIHMGKISMQGLIESKKLKFQPVLCQGSKPFSFTRSYTFKYQECHQYQHVQRHQQLQVTLT